MRKVISAFLVAMLVMQCGAINVPLLKLDNGAVFASNSFVVPEQTYISNENFDGVADRALLNTWDNTDYVVTGGRWQGNKPAGGGTVSIKNEKLVVDAKDAAGEYVIRRYFDTIKIPSRILVSEYDFSMANVGAQATVPYRSYTGTFSIMNKSNNSGSDASKASVAMCASGTDYSYMGYNKRPDAIIPGDTARQQALSGLSWVAGKTYKMRFVADYQTGKFKMQRDDGTGYKSITRTTSNGFTAGEEFDFREYGAIDFQDVFFRFSTYTGALENTYTIDNVKIYEPVSLAVSDCSKSINIGTADRMYVDFNQPIDATTLAGITVTKEGGTALTPTVAVDSLNGNRINFSFASLLHANAKYIVNIPSTVKSIYGTTLAVSKDVAFETGNYVIYDTFDGMTNGYTPSISEGYTVNSSGSENARIVDGKFQLDVSSTSGDVKIARELPSLLTGIVTVDYDFGMLTSAGFRSTTGSSALEGTTNDQHNSSVQYMAWGTQAYLGENSKGAVMNQSQAHNTLTWTPNKMYGIRFVVDYDTNTYKMYRNDGSGYVLIRRNTQNGYAASDDFLFRKTDVDGLKRISFLVGYLSPNANTYFIDNLRIYTTTDLFEPGNVSFTDGSDAPLTALTANSVVKAKAIPYNNNIDGFKDAMLILALYSSDNKLIGTIAKDNARFLPQMNEELVASFTLPSTLPENSKLKAFIWNGLDAVKPLKTFAQFPSN